MKRIRLMFAFALACCGSVHAQQSPYYTQYVLNPFIYNPALAGVENYWDVKLSYRHQWQGVEGAPRTTYLTVNGPLRRIQNNKSTTATVPSHLRGKNPTANAHWKNYKSASPHGGAGMVVYYDHAGPLSIYAASVAYAYHLGLTPRHSMSAGISAGVHGYRVNNNRLNFGTANPDDPVIGAVESRVAPQLNLGIWFYSPFYFIGVAADNLVSGSLLYSGEGFDGKFKPHYTFSAGYKMLPNDDLSFLPSVVTRYVQGAPLTWDVNLKFQYRNNVWAGVTARSTRTMAFIFGANVNSRFSFGYSYDFSAGQVGPPAPSHEIVLGYLIGNKDKVLCPRDFW